MTKHISIETKDVGETVVCDVCSEDWTNRTESGGFLFGTYAYCPDCAKKRISGIINGGEARHIRAYCPKGMSFKDWVILLRGGDNTIKTITVERR
jgi:hypothetical protein